MFEDSDPIAVEFRSNLRATDTSASDMQTDIIHSNNVLTQCEFEDKGIQTEYAEPINTTAIDNYRFQSLDVIHNILRQEKDPLYANYRANWAPYIASFSFTSITRLFEDLDVLDFATSHNRQRIALISGVCEHDGWCSHAGKLVIVSSLSYEVIKVVDFSCCLLSVTFHPLNPNIVVVGTYEGDITVIDTLSENYIIATTSTEVVGARKPVVCLRYIFTGKMCYLFALAADGKLTLWELVEQKLTARMCFYTLPTSKHSFSTNFGSFIPTTFDFLHNSSNIITTDVRGRLLKCKTSIKFDPTRLKSVKAGNQIYTGLDSVGRVLQHTEFSNAFWAYSDQEIHLYKISTRNPLFSFYPSEQVICVTQSLHNPGLVFFSCSDCTIRCVDFSRKTKHDILYTFLHPVTLLFFNPNNRNVLICVTADREMHYSLIPSSFSTQMDSGQDFVDNFL
ncbi:hypothetical protein PCE1_003801 [Barthelona sp. PCE]